MAKVEEKGIQTKKAEDMSKWYEEVCLKSEIVEFSTVKGCMVIRPRGYSIWEKIKEHFELTINKPLGVKNAYFPLFIPESFFHKETEHAEGFSPEVAWIDKELTGDGERLAIRPTSETIMYDSYSRWIRSYRDLPLKINQWCNVVRWETKATRLFLRSREFLWQEGHNVYETPEECETETIDIIKRYAALCENLLAMPVLVGKKSEKEKFAGAVHTYTIEGFMPDGKALQSGTSHNLGDGFGKAFGISFLGKDEKKHTPFQNSWGLSTRLIGGLVMTHSDDKGLVLPPMVAENKLVIIPLIFKKDKEAVLEKAKELTDDLKAFNPILDDSEEYSPGYKYAEYELQGIPLRIELGPRDLENNQVMIKTRIGEEKIAVPFSELEKRIPEILEEMQNELLRKAKERMDSQKMSVSSTEGFEKAIEKSKLIRMNWCGEPPCELDIKEKTGATTRCTLLEEEKAEGECPFCNKEAKEVMYFSRSY
ncbi:MAG: proline--tRNA ligase [Nanoarchaeota archaeon]|jgi:prolyl-tRNA synthetase|nr:proline--tRNA ligase [Nanoarchaeota archaeon]